MGDVDLASSLPTVGRRTCAYGPGAGAERAGGSFRETAVFGDDEKTVPKCFPVERGRKQATPDGDDVRSRWKCWTAEVGGVEESKGGEQVPGGDEVVVLWTVRTWPGREHMRSDYVNSRG